MQIAWIFALLGPILWAFMNVLDKYIVEHRVKSPLGFASVAACINVLLGLILCIILPWDQVNLAAVFLPGLAGVMLGIQIFFYYNLISKTDASYVIGLYYIYPIFVTFLSLLFLHEVLPILSYVGILLTILGAVLLSLRANKLKFKLIGWSLFGLITTGTLCELFIKFSTEELPILHGVAISNIGIGVAVLFALSRKKVRIGFVRELKNIPLALATEAFTMVSCFVLFLAMDGLPLSIVASVGASQPMFVLFFEHIAHWHFGKMTKDTSLRKKAFPLLLIIAGIALLYMG